jgi:hypothetical protein
MRRRRPDLEERRASIEALEMLQRGILRRAREASRVASANFTISIDVAPSRTQTR